MTKTALVLGASGAFGGQMALALEDAGWRVNRYRRGTDMTAAARGAALIVNGLNPPGYHNWDVLIPQITASVIAAGRASGATLLIPGNVYPYGLQPAPWGPDTPHRPNSRKGRIRAEMEASYRQAAEDGGPRAILLRGGDFMLPSAPQLLMNQITLAGAANGRITAMGAADAVHAYAYLPDMTKAAVALAELGTALPAYADIPFAGHAFTIDHLAERVARLTGRKMRVTHFPLWYFTFVSPFWELARELREMLYLNQVSHRMDPEPLRLWLPEFRNTPLDIVLEKHLVALGAMGGEMSAAGRRLTEAAGVPMRASP